MKISMFFALLLSMHEPVFFNIGLGGIVLALLIFFGGAGKAIGQIYINSYRFAAAGFPLWNKDPYTTTDISNTLTEVTALGATQSLTISTFGNAGTTTFKWIGGVLAPNGKIYGIPYNSTSILEIDPTNNSISTFGN